MLKEEETQGTKTLTLDFFIFYSRFPLMLHTGCNPFAEAWQLGPEIWVRQIQLASILEAPAVSGTGSEVWVESQSKEALPLSGYVFLLLLGTMYSFTRPLDVSMYVFIQLLGTMYSFIPPLDVSKYVFIQLLGTFYSFTPPLDVSKYIFIQLLGTMFFLTHP